MVHGKHNQLLLDSDNLFKKKIKKKKGGKNRQPTGLVILRVFHIRTF